MPDNAGYRYRWRLAFLMCAGVGISYIDRVNISHALIPLSRDLHLEPFQQGLLLSAFSLGYVCMMPVGGILISSIGPVRTILLSGTVWSASTALLGVSASPSMAALSRMVVGISEAPLFPANAQIVAETFPPVERARATALFDAGSYLGIAIAAPLVVYIMQIASWRWSFIACGCLSFAWVALWGYSRRHDIANASTTSPGPWKPLLPFLTSGRFISIGLGFFCYNYVKAFFLTWLPSYLVRGRGFSFGMIGLVGMLPALSAVLGELLGGWTSDSLLRKGYSSHIARRIPICSGLFLGGVSVVAVMATGNNALAVAALSLAFAFTIMASPAIWAIPADIAPSCSLVGPLGACQNTVSNFGGIVCPIVVGALIQKTGTFNVALLVTAAIAMCGSLLYWVALATPWTALREPA